MTQVQQNLFEVYPWYPGEMDVFRKREPLTVSQWAEKHRVVTMSSRPGPWRNSNAPYLVGIMDTVNLPWVQEIALCKAVQVGGTEVIYNCLGYFIDYNPSTALVVMPDEKSSKDVSMDRIRPAIESSPQLRELLTKNPDDMAKFRMRFRNGMLVYLAWSSAPAQLASKPIEFLFLDEVDKYPAHSGKKKNQEADPISLAKDRTTTFPHTRKIIMTSTPTTETNFIWSALEEAEEIRDYHVPCIHCGTFQVMKFDQIKYPEGVDSKRIKRKKLAYYECEHCGGHWSDTQRDMAVRAGQWQAREPVERPQTVGFHLPAYYSQFWSLSDIVADYLDGEAEAKIGQKGKLMNHYNSVRAEPYTEAIVDRKEDAILALRDDRPRGMVPPDVSCLLAAVDTQKRGFYYEIRAWGYGIAMESWLVREGYVMTFAELDEVLFKSVYRTAQGEEHIVNFAVIDSGGTRSDSGESRTSEVYDYCLRSRRIVPIKGQDKKNKAWGVTELQNYPGSKKPLPGGLKLYTLNVTFFKNFLAAKLMINPTDPGAWHLHSETSDQYAKHMCVEYQDERGLWLCPRGKRNDFWDCGVYQLAAAEIYGVKYKKRPPPPEPQKKSGNKKTKQPQNRRW